ncbi:hypothetical protein FVW20_19380 [Desulfovibrio oxamicus]|uniref:Antitoxin SocA-like Panacea domain-containing protein n=1 Tax=Nitratidesulfovibrio oxamicus TaxID=32016 RepID=A0ABS0JAD0_9BACT|nr:hypothetical protein [Nitratidesulfovibrio oxamicus]MBG3879095.1 hypothetical protein [Nitratidesulfovibrio oxamicus]
MADLNRQIVCELLDVMQEHGVELTKINIQKTAYFLTAWGVSLGLRFRPYTYGPYSGELSRCLEDLAFWDNLAKKGDKAYEVLELPERPDLRLDEKARISACVTALYDAILGKKAPSFDEMEVYGTVLYCRNALKAAAEEDVTEDAILKQFKAWKGDAYPDAKVRAAIQNLERHLVA